MSEKKREGFATGYQAGVRAAASEIERKHIGDGHHGPDHYCRTRNWILALIGEGESKIAAAKRARAEAKCGA